MDEYSFDFTKRISSVKPLLTPDELRRAIPITPETLETVEKGRRDVHKTIFNEDERLLVVVGPCSIHDKDGALAYAKRLAKIKKEVESSMVIVMRVYFEKPRTSTGWKGFIVDPQLDGSSDMMTGLIEARKVLMQINEMGLPCATEFLEPITPPYISELISWAAIGARTTESQVHREMASGLSMPVGFKNATSGDITVAFNAMKSASSPHTFLGINGKGEVSVIKTTGNHDVHLILRGGSGGTNFSVDHLRLVGDRVHEYAGNRLIMVDCSHANSQGNYKQQREVFDHCLAFFVARGNGFLGMMLESNLFEGKQPLSNDLQYGVSITDACIGWEETESILLETHQILLNKTIDG